MFTLSIFFTCSMLLWYLLNNFMKFLSFSFALFFIVLFFTSYRRWPLFKIHKHTSFTIRHFSKRALQILPVLSFHLESTANLENENAVDAQWNRHWVSLFSFKLHRINHQELSCSHSHKHFKLSITIAKSHEICLLLEMQLWRCTKWPKYCLSTY